MVAFELPTLYFSGKGQALRTIRNDSLALPSELVHHCLTSFADFGDLAKLSCVQREWSTVLYDSVEKQGAYKWELACALLEGSRGLKANQETMAWYLLEQLVALNGVTVDASTRSPLYTNNKEINDNSCSKPLSNEFATKAMRKLGFLFFEGAEKCSNTGLQWLQCAFVTGNDLNAAYEMALIYEYGRYGVDSDPVSAFKWFGIAARAGHVESMAELALCYELGCGVEPNDEIALDWYMKAAQAGNITAKFSVGEYFEEARGVPQSDSEACLWYYKAAAAGCADSRKALKRLEDIARIVVPGVRALLDV